MHQCDEHKHNNRWLLMHYLYILSVVYTFPHKHVLFLLNYTDKQACLVQLACTGEAGAGDILC